MNTSDNIVKINLKEYFWSLLEQWKCVVAAGLIFAVLVPVALSLKDIRTRKADQEAVRTLSSMSREEMLDTLNDDERNAVLLDTYLDQLIKNRSSYNDNSIFAGMDSDNFIVLHYSFVVNGSESAQICSAYASALRDSNTVNIVRGTFGDAFKDIDEGYIREMILTSSDGCVDLKVIMPEGTDEAALAEGLESRIEEIHSQIESALGKHDLTFIVSEKQELAYDELAAEIVLKMYDLSILEERYDGVYYAMNDSQRTVLWMLTTSQEEIEAYINEPVSSSIEFSKGRIAIGFVVGIFLYAFIYLVYIVFSSIIQNPDLFAETYKIRSFGTVSNYRYKGISAFIHGKFFYKMHRKDSMGDPAADAAADAVLTACEQKGLNKTGIILAGNMKDYSSQCDKVIKKLKDSSKLEVVKLDGKLSDSSISKLDCVVICAGSGKTKYSNVKDVIRICEYYKKEIIGGIYFD